MFTMDVKQQHNNNILAVLVYVCVCGGGGTKNMLSSVSAADTKLPSIVQMPRYCRRSPYASHPSGLGLFSA